MSAKLFVIDDATPDRDLQPPPGTPSDGYEWELRGPQGYAGVAEPFPSNLVIPESDWRGMIEEAEEQLATPWHTCQACNLHVKDQQQTNYCWINAPTYVYEIRRCMEGQEDPSRPMRFSPASAGAIITGYRNVGGWGKPGLEHIIEKGLVPNTIWPDNAIDSRYATPENLAIARRYRGQEWWELTPRSLPELVSAILLRLPVALGYNWWRHEVTGVRLRWLDGTVALDIGNSWGRGWGTDGFGTIQGNRMLPDDAVTLRSARAAA